MRRPETSVTVNASPLASKSLSRTPFAFVFVRTKSSETVYLSFLASGGTLMLGSGGGGGGGGWGSVLVPGRTPIGVRPPSGDRWLGGP
jgi:hypothetical protein